MQGVGEGDALRWLVLEHLLDQIEQVSVILRVRHDVSLQTHSHTVNVGPVCLTYA